MVDLTENVPLIAMTAVANVEDLTENAVSTEMTVAVIVEDLTEMTVVATVVDSTSHLKRKKVSETTLTTAMIIATAPFAHAKTVVTNSTVQKLAQG